MFYRYVDISITFEKVNLNTEFLLIPNFSLNFIVTLILATMVLSFKLPSCDVYYCKEIKLSIKDFFSKCEQIRKIADFVAFNEEFLNGKLHFLCSVYP